MKRRLSSITILTYRHDAWALPVVLLSTILLMFFNAHLCHAFTSINRRALMSTSQHHVISLAAVKTASSVDSSIATSSRLKRTVPFTEWAKQNDIK